MRQVGLGWIGAACAFVMATGFVPLAHAQQRTDASPNYTGGNRFTCESNDDKRHSCRVDTRGGVVLLHQISSAQCVRGRSWNYDRQGVWVDAGCRGEFQTGRGDSARPRRLDAASNAQTLKCESDNDRQRRCAVAVHRNAVLQQQLSDTACVEGRTWGWDRAGIWVDRGCRAVFRVY